MTTGFKKTYSHHVSTGGDVDTMLKNGVKLFASSDIHQCLSYKSQIKPLHTQYNNCRCPLHNWLLRSPKSVNSEKQKTYNPTPLLIPDNTLWTVKYSTALSWIIFLSCPQALCYTTDWYPYGYLQLNVTNTLHKGCLASNILQNKEYRKAPYFAMWITGVTEACPAV